MCGVLDAVDAVGAGSVEQLLVHEHAVVGEARQRGRVHVRLSEVRHKVLCTEATVLTSIQCISIIDVNIEQLYLRGLALRPLVLAQHSLVLQPLEAHQPRHAVRV